jgi:hypothetical protein
MFRLRLQHIPFYSQRFCQIGIEGQIPIEVHYVKSDLQF